MVIKDAHLGLWVHVWKLLQRKTGIKSWADSHSNLSNQPAFQRLIPFPLSSIITEKNSLYVDRCSHHMAVPIIYDMKKFGEMLYHNLWVTLNDDLAFINQNV
jgi:hypothetical protein